MPNPTALAAPPPDPKGTWWSDVDLDRLLEVTKAVALRSFGIDPDAPPAQVVQLRVIRP